MITNSDHNDDSDTGVGFDVVSNDQVGGITVGQLNVGGSPANVPAGPKSHGLPAWAKWLAWGVGILAGLLGIVGVGFVIFGDGSESKMADEFNVTSNNQQGGITAGIVIIEGELGPKIELSEVVRTEIETGFRFEATLAVGSQYSVPQIRIAAFADSIMSLDVVPLRGGALVTGAAGRREEFHFTTLLNAAGSYRVRVETREGEPIRFELSD